jgi:hypothetical protein
MMKNMITVGPARMRESSIGDLNLLNKRTRSAMNVSTVSRKLAMGWHNPDKLIEATDFTPKQFGGGFGHYRDYARCRKTSSYNGALKRLPTPASRVCHQCKIISLPLDHSR